MPDRTGIFGGWSANLSNFLGLGVEAGASPMYPQKMRVPPPPPPGSHKISNASYLICIFVNFNENFKNERKIVKKSINKLIPDPNYHCDFWGPNERLCFCLAKISSLSVYCELV